MRVGTLYSASDKALFDALNQKNVTNADLRQLFLTRGILVSSETSRKQLAFHFARLFHDFHDYQTLAKLFGGGGQRDKLSSVRLTTKATIENFQAGAFELKADLESGGASVHVFSTKGNRLDVEIKYTKVQFNKSEFRQLSIRTALISIYKEDHGFTIHTPHTEEAKEWIEKIAKTVREKCEGDLEFDEISLPSGMDAKVKTAFFTHLVRAIPGLPIRDVSDVYVTKPRKINDKDDDLGSPEVRIDKATLRGQGVIESEELSLFEKKGFYVSRIVWTAKSQQEHADIYEFEAQWGIPDECKDFNFLPRGFYKYTEGGDYSQTRTGFSTEDERRYGALIESAARATIKTLPGHGHA